MNIEAEVAMTLLNGEQCVSRSLREILVDLPLGASLYDHERSHYGQTGDLFPCLEYFLTAVLREIHLEWREENFDGVDPMFARKIGHREAELFGLCILISDQAHVPFHLLLQVATDTEEVSWLEFSVGERGHEGMIRSYSRSLYNRIYVLQENPQQIDWAYQVMFGNRDS
jgi:hypothetical protein